MLSPEGERLAFESVILDLVEDERIVLDFAFVGPDPGRTEGTLFTVTFRDAPAGATEVVLEHERIEYAPPNFDRAVRQHRLEQRLRQARDALRKELKHRMHRTATRDQWRTERIELLEREKQHTRQGDELARARQELPWVPVEQDYAFDTPDGRRTLAELFDGRSQLLVYHFMLGPGTEAPCASCSSIADGVNGPHLHLEHHDVAFTAISRAPLAEIEAYRARMGWSFRWVSSEPSDFNVDFGVSSTEERPLREYNFAPMPA